VLVGSVAEGAIDKRELGWNITVAKFSQERTLAKVMVLRLRRNTNGAELPTTKEIS